MVTTKNGLTPPSTIITAFFGFLASTVVSLAAIVLLAGSHGQLVDSLRQSNPSMTDEQLQSTATLGLGFAIGVAAVIALVHLWLAFKLKAGRNWARVVLTVITLLQLASIVATQGNTAVGYASCAIAVVAVVLSYLPASNAYIADVKRSA
ncbi:hypothetical protein [Umezawaea tangerina]|nr:hypothetical protein [Umezawaea tangerina]